MIAADEQRLVEQAKNGDQDAFRLLVERHMKQAYNVAYGFVNDHDDASDIAQESFVRAYQSLRSYRGDAMFSTWLHRIVTNLSLNRMRQKKQRAGRELQLTDVIIQPAATEDGPAPDIKMHIERALHELPTLQRAAVILRHLNGLSTKQVSSILACSEGTVKTHVYRGMMKLKEQLSFLNGEIV